MGEWRFLLDENIDPATIDYLKDELDVVHVRDVLGEGADDEDDILPYVVENRLIVTSDVSDFGQLSDDIDTGVILLYDDAMPAHQVASRIITMVDEYEDPAEFGGREVLDSWPGARFSA